MQILDPTSPNPRKRTPAPTLENLAGKRIAFLNNGWRSMSRIGRHIEPLLKSRYRIAELVCFDIPRNREPADGLLDRIADEFDAAIVGMAN